MLTSVMILLSLHRILNMLKDGMLTGKECMVEWTMLQQYCTHDYLYKKHNQCVACKLCLTPGNDKDPV